MMKRLLIALMVVGVLGASVTAMAQSKAAQKEAAAAAKKADAKAKAKWDMTEDQLTAPFLGSFMFSGAETALIQKALIGRVDRPPPQLKQEPKKKGKKKRRKRLTKQPLEVEKQQVEETLKVEKKVIPARRVIQVSGVLWRGIGDWTVWINGKKVTPKELMPEIIEIKVENSSKVYLKWYDVGLNKVISITLRPNQTYDITTGLLLPG